MCFGRVAVVACCRVSNESLRSDATDQHHAVAFDQQLLHAPCLHLAVFGLALTRVTWL